MKDGLEGGFGFSFVYYSDVFHEGKPWICFCWVIFFVYGCFIPWDEKSPGIFIQPLGEYALEQANLRETANRDGRCIIKLPYPAKSHQPLDLFGEYIFTVIMAR